MAENGYRFHPLVLPPGTSKPEFATLGARVASRTSLLNHHRLHFWVCLLQYENKQTELEVSQIRIKLSISARECCIYGNELFEQQKTPRILTGVLHNPRFPSIFDRVFAKNANSCLGRFSVVDECFRRWAYVAWVFPLAAGTGPRFWRNIPVSINAQHSTRILRCLRFVQLLRSQMRLFKATLNTHLQ